MSATKSKARAETATSLRFVTRMIPPESGTGHSRPVREAVGCPNGHTHGRGFAAVAASLARATSSSHGNPVSPPVPHCEPMTAET